MVTYDTKYKKKREKHSGRDARKSKYASIKWILCVCLCCVCVYIVEGFLLLRWKWPKLPTFMKEERHKERSREVRKTRNKKQTIPAKQLITETKEKCKAKKLHIHTNKLTKVRQWSDRKTGSHLFALSKFISPTQTKGNNEGCLLNLVQLL